MDLLNRPLPDFALPDLNGHLHRLSDGRGRIVIVNFWSCECPHVERTDAALLTLLQRWGEAVWLLPIASNANESVEALDRVARAHGLPWVLHDPHQEVADRLGATVTPEVFIVDREGVLRYHGAPDDVTFRQRTPTRSYVEEVVEALLAGTLPSLTETPPFGCSIVRQ